MESRSTEPMDIPGQRRGRRSALNLVTGIFLKSIFFLNQECSKYVLVGVFADHGNSVGILVKGKKGFVFYTPEVFNQFLVLANQVSEALDTDGVRRFSIDSGEDIVVKKVFGNKYAVLFDGQHTLTLTRGEWIQFTNSLPCLNRQITELFLCEDLLRSYIIDILASEEYVTAPEGLPLHLQDRLFDEVSYFKRWPNGGG